MQHLQPGATLQGGRYKIENLLGKGGFGITYLAIQSGLERKVAIKEFFMKELCERDESTSHVTLGTEGSRDTVNRFREKFLKEARNIARLNHPNIVRIIDVFEENGTAYYVMEYAENGSLDEKVKREGYLSEPVATRYILQIAEALDYIHQLKMNHLDVKPANIMLNEKDEAVLIDFGLSKQYDAVTGNQTSTTPVGISEGYAPMEQYMQGGVGAFSPETDIYSLGATFYKLLTGITPPNASLVNNEGLPIDELQAKGVSQKAMNIICKAMEGRKKDRMKDARTFIDGLNTHEDSAINGKPCPTPIVDEETVPIVDTQKKKDEEPKQAPKKAASKKIWLWAAVGVVVIAAAIIGICSLNSNSTNDIEATSTTSNDEGNNSKTFTANGVSFDMMLVEAGSFTMGATLDVDNPDEDEIPAHEVTLTKSYYIGKTEVTQALWGAVMGEYPSYFEGDDKPVRFISWDECQTFISKLNSLTGQNFRMPTEAEWEFAARGGKKGVNYYYYSGSNRIDDVACYYDNCGAETHAVASHQPNELGIYDMSGNVSEWCNDWYGEYRSDKQTDPTGPDNGDFRVSRGGAWASPAESCRVMSRRKDDQEIHADDLGLRLALSK